MDLLRFPFTIDDEDIELAEEARLAEICRVRPVVGSTRWTPAAASDPILAGAPATCLYHWPFVPRDHAETTRTTG